MRIFLTLLLIGFAAAAIILAALPHSVGQWAIATDHPQVSINDEVQGARCSGLHLVSDRWGNPYVAVGEYGAPLELRMLDMTCDEFRRSVRR